MSPNCSHCRSNVNFPNCLCSTCPSAPAKEDSSIVEGSEIMLFGVRVKIDPMRKSVSMNNLSEYEQPNQQSSMTDVAAAVDTGYATADEAVRNPSNATRERKRGTPWTEDEHKMFLIGLQNAGKGDWRGISKNFVKTRTPTQVASHAQKYFLRRSNLNRRRRRSSLFDITTDTIAAIPMEEEQVHGHNNKRQCVLEPPSPMLLPFQETSALNNNGFPTAPFQAPVGPVLIPLVQIDSSSLGMPNEPADITNARQKPAIDNSFLSLKLSLSLSSSDQYQSTHSAFQMMSSFNNGDDNFITVA